MRIQKKFTVAMLVTALLPLMLSMGLALWNSSQQTTKLTLDSAQGRLDTAAQKLSSFFSNRIAEVSTYSQTATLNTMFFPTIRPFLMAELERHENVYEKFIVGTPEGHFYNTSGGNPGVRGLRTFNDRDPNAKPKHIRKRDYWQKTVGHNSNAEQITYVSDPMVSYTTGAKQVVVASSILSEKGVIKGMIGGALPWTDIQSRIHQAHENLLNQLAWDAKFFLISHSGTYWHHWDPEKIVHLKLDESGKPSLNDIGEKEIVKHNIQEDPTPEIVLAGERMTKGESGHTSFQDPHTQETNYLIYSPVPSANYSIGLIVPRAQLLAPVQSLQVMFFYAFLVAVFFVVFVALLVSKRISSPIVSLNEMIKKISQGNWNIKLQPKGNDEIFELTMSFNTMAKSLEKRESALLKSEEKLEKINSELEQRIAERTRELEESNESLRNQADDLIAAESIISSSEDLLKKTGHLAHVGGWKLDVADNKLNWTEETYQIHNLPPDNNIKIENVMQCYSQDSADQFAAAINDAIENGTAFDLELLLTNSHAKNNWTRVICHAQTKAGKVTELIGAYQDISELKKIENLKSEFVSVVSHELRTPLTSLRGSLALLSSGKLISIENEQAAQMLDVAERNSERLLLLINDLLDMEKIESGNIDFKFNHYSIDELLQQSYDENKTYGEKHGIEIHLPSKNLNTLINVDKERFSQVMSNLISNAVKFTSANTSVEILAEPIESDYIRVSVRDHGKGIPDNFKDKIFNKFSQADGSDTRQQGGTGLGLSISKTLIEQMGGNIDYTSTLNKGSTFYITLPIVSAEEITP